MIIVNFFFVCTSCSVWAAGSFSNKSRIYKAKEKSRELTTVVPWVSRSLHMPTLFSQPFRIFLGLFNIIFRVFKLCLVVKIRRITLHHLPRSRCPWNWCSFKTQDKNGPPYHWQTKVDSLCNVVIGISGQTMEFKWPWYLFPLKSISYNEYLYFGVPNVNPLFF